MKKIILIMLTCFMLADMGFTYNLNDLQNRLAPIESEIKSYGGENISLEKRVENAEISVFGEKKSGDLAKRITSLSEALGLAQIVQSEEPKYEMTYDDGDNYPVVDKLEKQLFGKVYKENIYQRLDRLEKKVDGKISSNSLNERVAHLREKILPETANADFDTQGSEYNYYSPQNYSQDEISKAEKKYFNKTFEDEDAKTRQERIKAVEKAKKNDIEYKANKFAKYASTGLQIGGLVLLILALVL